MACSVSDSRDSRQQTPDKRLLFSVSLLHNGTYLTRALLLLPWHYGDCLLAWLTPSRLASPI